MDYEDYKKSHESFNTLCAAYRRWILYLPRGLRLKAIRMSDEELKIAASYFKWHSWGCEMYWNILNPIPDDPLFYFQGTPVYRRTK